MDGSPGGQAIVDILAEEFKLLVNLKEIFRTLPPPYYEHFIDLDIALRIINEYKYPMGK